MVECISGEVRDGFSFLAYLFLETHHVGEGVQKPLSRRYQERGGAVKYLFVVIVLCVFFTSPFSFSQEFDQEKIAAVKELERRYPSLIRLDLLAKSKSGWKRHAFLDQGWPGTLEHLYRSCVCLFSAAPAQC